jgi:hypothetical protein
MVHYVNDIRPRDMLVRLDIDDTVGTELEQVS